MPTTLTVTVTTRAALPDHRVYPGTTSKQRVLTDFGFFASAREAKANGWGGEFPCGITDELVGKYQRELFVVRCAAGIPARWCHKPALQVSPERKHALSLWRYGRAH